MATLAPSGMATVRKKEGPATVPLFSPVGALATTRSCARFYVNGCGVGDFSVVYKRPWIRWSTGGSFTIENSNEEALSPNTHFFAELVGNKSPFLRGGARKRIAVNAW